MLSDKDIEMISEAAKKYLDGDSPTFKFISKQQEEFFKRRSGEMANTLPLKGNEETPLAGSSPASGITYNENLKAILDNRVKQYKELIKDPNHPYLIYLQELVKKYDSNSD